MTDLPSTPAINPYTVTNLPRTPTQEVTDPTVQLSIANALLKAAIGLETAEWRIVMLAMKEQQDAQSSANTLHLTVTAKDYAKWANVTADAAYKALREAASVLFTRQFTYDKKLANGSTTRMVARWLQEAGYNGENAHVEIVFTDHVRALITRLSDDFSRLMLENVRGFSSAHAHRLYHLLLAERFKGPQVTLSIAAIREQLGIEPQEYPVMSNFKARVIDAAMAQINKHSDMKIKYVQVKYGRKITHLTFTLTMKPKLVEDAGAKPKRVRITKAKAQSMANENEKWKALYTRLSGLGFHIVLTKEERAKQNAEVAAHAEKQKKAGIKEQIDFVDDAIANPDAPKVPTPTPTPAEVAAEFEAIAKAKRANTAANKREMAKAKKAANAANLA